MSGFFRNVNFCFEVYNFCNNRIFLNHRSSTELQLAIQVNTANIFYMKTFLILFEIKLSNQNDFYQLSLSKCHPNFKYLD